MASSTWAHARQTAGPATAGFPLHRPGSWTVLRLRMRGSNTDAQEPLAHFAQLNASHQPRPEARGAWSEDPLHQT